MIESTSTRKNTTRNFVKRFYQWVADRRLEYHRDTAHCCYVEVLETRMMLDGDSDTETDTIPSPSLFQLPAEVSGSLSTILENAATYSAGIWTSNTPDEINGSNEWATGLEATASDEDQWLAYDIDENAPTGLTQSILVDSTELDGGGFLVYVQESESDRTIETEDAGGNPGDPSGGVSGDGTLGAPGQFESIDSTITTTIVWAQTQADVDAITAAQSVDPAAYSGSFVVTVNYDFVFEDNAPDSAVRDFSVSLDYDVTVMYAWSGLYTSSDSDETTGGVTTTTIDYDASGMLVFEGSHLYDPIYSQDPSGEITGQAFPSGSFNNSIQLNSGNDVVSNYVEGDTSSGGIGTAVTATTNHGLDYTYSAGGNYLYAVTLNSDGVATSRTGGSNGGITAGYDLDVDMTTRVDYLSRVDLSTADTGAQEEDGSGDGSGSDDGSGESSEEEAYVYDSIIATASGFYDSTVVLNNNGTTVSNFYVAESLGGSSLFSFDSSNIDTVDTTGTTFRQYDSVNSIAESSSRQSSLTVTSDISLESDQVTETTTMIDIDLNRTAEQIAANEDGVLTGSIDMLTEETLSRTKIDSEFTFNHWMIDATELPDENGTAAPAALSDAAISFANNYTPLALVPMTPVPNPSAAHSETDRNIFFYSAGGKDTSTYEQTNSKVNVWNTNIDFIDETQTTIATDGDSDYDFTTVYGSKHSRDMHLASGSFAATENDAAPSNGAYSTVHFDVTNDGTNHGTISDQYDLNILVDDPDTEETPPSEGDGGDSNETEPVPEPEVTLTGNSTSTVNTIFDTDVTTAIDSSRSAGRYHEGELNEDHDWLSWTDTYDFNETETLTGGSSNSTLANDHTAGTSKSHSTGDGNINTTIDGNGSTSHALNIDRAYYHDETNSDGSSETDDSAPSLPTGDYTEEIAFSTGSNLTSSGGNGNSWTTDVIYNIIDNTVETGTGDGSGDGDAGGPGGPEGGETGGDQPSYLLNIGDDITVSHQGDSSSTENYDYELLETTTNFSFDFNNTASNLAIGDGGPSSTVQTGRLELGAGPNDEKITIDDNTVSRVDFREDGIYSVADGEMTVTTVSRTDLKNTEEILDQRVYSNEYGNNTSEAKMAPDDYHVVYNNTATQVYTYDDFGTRTELGSEEILDEETVAHVGWNITAEAFGTGSLTILSTAAGDESLDKKVTTTDTLNNSYGGGTSTHESTLQIDGEWDHNDTMIGTYADVSSDHEDAGKLTVIHSISPGDFRTLDQQSTTRGDFDYSFTSPADSDQWVTTTEQNGDDGTGDGYAYHTTTDQSILVERGGTVTMEYDANGELTDKSGSYTTHYDADGQSSATSMTQVTKTKARGFDGPASNLDPDIHDQLISQNVVSNLNETVAGTESVTAYRKEVQTSNDNYDTDIVDTVTFEEIPEGEQEENGPKFRAVHTVTGDHTVDGHKTLLETQKVTHRHDFNTGHTEEEVIVDVVDNPIFDDGYGPGYDNIGSTVDFDATDTNSTTFSAEEFAALDFGFYDQGYKSYSHRAKPIDTSFADVELSGLDIGGAEAGNGIGASGLAELGLAQDEGDNATENTDQDGFLTKAQIIIAYQSEYGVDDPLYKYFVLGGGKIEVQPMYWFWSSNYWAGKKGDLIRFDDGWENTQENLADAVKDLRRYLEYLASRNDSGVNQYLSQWNGNVNDFFDNAEQQGVKLGVFTRPTNMNAADVEALNDTIVFTLEAMPVFGGFVATGELATGQKLSFTTYGERELSGTERVMIIGTSYAGTTVAFATVKFIFKGGKWVAKSFSTFGDDLAAATRHADDLAPKSAVRYVYDGAADRYRDTVTGRFVAARDLPWPPNAGFASSTTGTVKAGTILDRYGSPTGRFLGEPGASISQRGMAAGSDAMQYTRYRVLRPFEAKYGPAAAVPEFGASGGAIQYRHLQGKSIQWLIDNGFLEIIK